MRLKELVILFALVLLGGGVAYIDHQLQWHTMLTESVHAMLVTVLVVFCLVCQRRYPFIRRCGWQPILLGLTLLMIGSWVDLLDDPPALAWLEIADVPFGRSWQQAFLKKILGYTVGIGLIAYGFSQWVPWMIKNHGAVQKMDFLTKREKEVLSALCRGYSNQQLAEVLHVSPKTVHNHLYKIYNKINVKTRAQAIVWTLEYGIANP